MKDCIKANLDEMKGRGGRMMQGREQIDGRR